MREPIQAGIFADQSVTQADIDAWLRAVPGLDPSSPRAAAYVRGYDVAGKIRHAKAIGQFDQLTKGK